MYLIPLISRKDAIIEAFKAKFTFCGRSPLACAILSAFSLEVTIPTRLPFWSSSGPPLLPAWTGVDICKYRESSPMPASAVTLPCVKLPLVASKSAWG